MSIVINVEMARKHRNENVTAWKCFLWLERVGEMKLCNAPRNVIDKATGSLGEKCIFHLDKASLINEENDNQ